MLNALNRFIRRALFTAGDPRRYSPDERARLATANRETPRIDRATLPEALERKTEVRGRTVPQPRPAMPGWRRASETPQVFVQDRDDSFLTGMLVGSMLSSAPSPAQAPTSVFQSGQGGDFGGGGAGGTWEAPSDLSCPAPAPVYEAPPPPPAPCYEAPAPSPSYDSGSSYSSSDSSSSSDSYSSSE
jgi:hypothetical protein